VVRIVVVITIVIIFAIILSKILNRNANANTNTNANTNANANAEHYTPAEKTPTNNETTDYTEESSNKLRQHVTDDIPVLDRRINVPHIFNQNWNTKWNKPSVSYNDPDVDNVPHSSTNEVIPQYAIVQSITSDEVNRIYHDIVKHDFGGLEKATQPGLAKFGKFTKINFPEGYLDNLNKKTWIDRWQEYNPNILVNFKTIESPIMDVNNILARFLEEMNARFRKFFYDRIAKYGYDPFFIYKYRIIRIEKNSDIPPFYKYTFLLSLFRKSSTSDTTCIVEAIVREDIIKFNHIKEIGTYSMDTLLLPEGVDKLANNKNEKYDSLQFYTANAVFNNKVVSEINNEHNPINDSTSLTNQYACFNADPNIIENPKFNDQLTIANTGKLSCENKYDYYGRAKPYGIWDKPCVNDSDCLYFNANKNYPNNYGKCLTTGYCQLPLNMLHIGYHYYLPTDKRKPLCYNCETTEWNPITKMGQCCDEQKDRKKYPFLNSPDYAYTDDYTARLNATRQEKCTMKFTYKMPLSNKPINTLISCK
jgi:hypothetical protein